MKYGVGTDVLKGKSTVAILSIEGKVMGLPFDINHDLTSMTFRWKVKWNT